MRPSRPSRRGPSPPLQPPTPLPLVAAPPTLPPGIGEGLLLLPSSGSGRRLGATRPSLVPTPPLCLDGCRGYPCPLPLPLVPPSRTPKTPVPRKPRVPPQPFNLGLPHKFTIPKRKPPGPTPLLDLNVPTNEKRRDSKARRGPRASLPRMAPFLAAAVVCCIIAPTLGAPDTGNNQPLICQNASREANLQPPLFPSLPQPHFECRPLHSASTALDPYSFTKETMSNTRPRYRCVNPYTPQYGASYTSSVTSE